jgi:tetratricopeptide (TPR) repeat protein
MKIRMILIGSVMGLLVFAACSASNVATFTPYPTPDKNLDLAALNVARLKTLTIGQSREEVLERMKADPVDGCVKWRWSTWASVQRMLGWLPCEKREVIQNPYRTQTLEQGGTRYEVLFYYTGGVDPGGMISNQQLTPVIIENGKLAGWGWGHPLAQRILQPRTPTDQAGDLNNRAVSFRSQGRYTDAEPLFRQALDITEHAKGAEHLDVAIILNNLGELYYVQGRYAEAEPLYQRALAIKENVLGPDDLGLATTLENYAALLARTSREDQATTLAARAKLIRARHD